MDSQGLGSLKTNNPRIQLRLLSSLFFPPFHPDVRLEIHQRNKDIPVLREVNSLGKQSKPLGLNGMSW